MLGAPPVTTFAALQSLVAQGESETLEFKRSTAELRRAGETPTVILCVSKGLFALAVGVTADWVYSSDYAKMFLEQRIRARLSSITPSPSTTASRQPHRPDTLARSG